jgi:hypothetical protein
LKARGDILLVEWGEKAVICVNDSVVEFTSASCREHEMGEMIDVFLLPAVGVNESLNSPPCSFDCVHVSPRPLINESDQMVESAVCVAVGFQILVCRPAVTDDCSAGYHSGSNDNHQGVSGSVRNGHKEGLSGLSHCVSCLVLAPS